MGFNSFPAVITGTSVSGPILDQISVYLSEPVFNS